MVLNQWKVKLLLIYLGIYICQIIFLTSFTWFIDPFSIQQASKYIGISVFGLQLKMSMKKA